MAVLKHIGVLSAARMSAVLELIVGFIIGLFILLFGSLIGIVFGIRASLVIGVGLLILLMLPIALMILGFLCTGFETWLYNELSSRFGGVRLAIKKGRLVWIDPASSAKLAGILGAIVGAIAGIVVAIISLSRGSSVFALLGILAIPVFAVLFAVGLLALVAVGAYVYNYLAKKVGGIQLYFKGKELKKVGVYSYAKIEGLFGAIWGFVFGLTRTISSLFFLSYPVMMMAGRGSGFGVFSVIAFPIIYFVLSYVVALVVGVLYNWLVPRIGGVELTIS